MVRVLTVPVMVTVAEEGALSVVSPCEYEVCGIEEKSVLDVCS